MYVVITHKVFMVSGRWLNSNLNAPALRVRSNSNRALSRCYFNSFRFYRGSWYTTASVLTRRVPFLSHAKHSPQITTTTIIIIANRDRIKLFVASVDLLLEFLSHTVPTSDVNYGFFSLFSFLFLYFFFWATFKLTYRHREYVFVWLSRASQY